MEIVIYMSVFGNDYVAWVICVTVNSGFCKLMQALHSSIELKKHGMHDMGAT
ncbi:hypothetical protein Lalb_Chr07g0179821 [Lupinus albus]|uniref:Uncharacterized protein n=1 Tax=Lupinus albus TaxID=3870 RepID=A0A6A4Q8X6_LUPAL|nr:hypothetical protein Lalb_Chr07g0179821 [Lupinus albus]